MKRRKTRSQSGSFHVYFRGNNRSTVFYEPKDYIDFLIACESAAKENNTKINAFVLMTNHVHLHVTTNCLTKFMRSLLLRYVIKYNKQKGTSGKLFSTPFNSIPTNSSVSSFNTILYILKNPINAGICKQPEDYTWSSFRFYNDDENNALGGLININKDIVQRYVSGIDALKKEIAYFKSEETIRKSSFWPKVSNVEIINCFLKLLNGRQIIELKKDEIDTVIISLYFDYNATVLQIASVLHEHRSVVQNVINRFKSKK